MRFLQEIREDSLGWCIIVALALFIVVAFSRPARSHSWYDADCCSDRDCEPVTAISFVAGDSTSSPSWS